MNKLIIISFLLLTGGYGFGQQHDVNIKIKESELYFKQNIGDSLFNKTIDRKVKRKNRLHKNYELALEFLRPKLFEKYGKEKVQNQLPYLFYIYHGYWMFWGTLPKGKTGNVFLVIMDSETGHIEVMREVELVKPSRITKKN